MTGHLTAAWRAGSTDGRPGWRFQFGYDEVAIEELKRTIPAARREWNPEGGWWWVEQSREQELLELFPAFEAYMRQGALF